MFSHIKELFTRPSGYKISRSVRLRASATAYFNRTPASATNQQKWTWSGWVKRGQLSTEQMIFSAGSTANDVVIVEFSTADKLDIIGNVGGVTTLRKTTTAVYRDPSAWYHIVLSLDTTNATASNRCLLYVNGVQVTSFSTSTDPGLNATYQVNNTVLHCISRYSVSALYYVDGYTTEINFIDGQALTPSLFGQTNTVTGVWQPIKYTGTYGTNGFYLNFSDNSNNTAATIGKDYSGNGNNWTPNNISVTAGVTYDSMVDVPTSYADGGNGRGNYCVMNPLDSAVATISDGNLKYTLAAGSSYTTRSTIGMISGKWYAEWTWTAGTDSVVGIATSQASLSQYLGQNAYGWSYYNNGNKYTNATGTAYGASYAVNDVIGIAFDADAGTLTFYKNGTSQGTAFTSLTSGPYFFAVGSAASTGFFNFGQRPFSYTPPTGFVSLNTQNLPTPTISNGANYMAATTYTGTGTSQSISNTVNGISFQPDLVWIKSRSAISNNILMDAVRGASVLLSSDQTGAESSATALFSSFNSNGFSVTGTSSASNQNAATYIGWQWKAGGTSSSNTSGSITSTVSVGATQGFSVVTFTSDGTTAGGTVGHGLGVAPKMVIYKGRNTVDSWYVYHTSIGGSNAVFLNSTSASTATALFNATTPTSSVIQFKQSNWGAGNLVAYCFAEVAGYSKFGSYTGNGSADGPFVYCGFRPRFVMVKRTDSTGSWVMFDTSRETYNVMGAELAANSSAAEASPFSQKDFLSNGFKIRNTQTDHNASGGTYIFAAFAENPTKFAIAR